MTPDNLAEVWRNLRSDAANGTDPTTRVYRALGDSAQGIRASYRPDDDCTELLIEVPASWQQSQEPPQWQGIDIRIIPLTIGKGAKHQLSFSLEDSGSEDVFYHFTADLISMLEGIEDARTRASLVEECLHKWNQFFKRGGPAGLSTKGQMGLFAELLFLQDLIDAGISAHDALSAWKGPERGYHDFDVSGHVAEIKSTSGKEPRKVWISNERQLDERGTHSLHLVVRTLAITQGGGKTLPALVQDINQKIQNIPGAEAAYNARLLQAGYLKRHAPKYKRNFSLLKTNTYKVNDHIPRIIDLQAGLGDIRYTVLLSSLEPNCVDHDFVLRLMTGGLDASNRSH